MPAAINKLLDRTNWRILSALQRNARLPLSELGRSVNLSAPATLERVRKLEEAGVITGYRAEISAEAIGLPVMAFIRINTPTRDYPRFLAALDQMPEIVECHHIAGADSFIMKAHLPSNAHVEKLLERLSVFGRTHTDIVLSSPIALRTFDEVDVDKASRQTR
jgi:Lrp/AsnC family leucine-responsive transcriptional regulator